MTSMEGRREGERDGGKPKEEDSCWGEIWLSRPPQSPFSIFFSFVFTNSFKHTIPENFLIQLINET